MIFDNDIIALLGLVSCLLLSALSEGSVPKQIWVWKGSGAKVCMSYVAPFPLEMKQPLRVVLFHSALGAVGPFRAKFCFAAVTEVLVLVGAKPL